MAGHSRALAQVTRHSQDLFAISILAVTLAGCGAGGAPVASAPIVTPAATASATATSTLAPTPTPAPTVDLKAAGTAYLAMSAKLSNTLTPIFDELAARAHNEVDYIELNQGAATAYRTAIMDLAAIEVPAEVQGAVSALSDVLDKLAKEFEHTVADTTYDNVAAYDALNPKVGEFGAAIRKALGLPPPG